MTLNQHKDRVADGTKVERVQDRVSEQAPGREDRQRANGGSLVGGCCTQMRDPRGLEARAFAIDSIRLLASENLLNLLICVHDFPTLRIFRLLLLHLAN